MKYVVILVLLVILGGGAYVWWNTHEKAVAAAEAAATPITAKVERRDLKVDVQSTGQVASNRDVDIKCKASGNITVLPYTDVSATIPAEGLIMQLETLDQDNALKQAKAAVDADQASLEEAKLNYNVATLNLVTTRQKAVAALAYAKAKADDAHAKANRTQELFEQNLDSKEDLETANTTAASADADVQTADAAVKELDQQAISNDVKAQAIKEAQAQLDVDTVKYSIAIQNREYCTVTAPKADDAEDPPLWRISAITKGVSKGYLVQSGSSGASGGTTVMTLSDLSHIFILATVDESDIGKLLLKFGKGNDLPVDITADAFPGVSFHGKVVRIATTGVNTTNVVTFEVKIEVTSPNRQLLLPIMTTNVTITTSNDKGVLALPVNAVSRHFGESAATQSSNDPATTQVASADTQPAVGPTGGGHGGNGQHKHKKKDEIAIGDSRPIPATVQLLKADGTTESRDVTIGLTDGVYYEILSGLSEGDTVVVSANGSDSQWKNKGQNRSGMMSFRR